METVFLSPNQIDVALKIKSRARWNTEELSRAFTLRYLGKRSYIYLRETLKYPLPGISTLQKWAANINMRSGVLNDVMRVMEIVGRDKNSFQKTTVLSFDEVKVSSVYEYDQKQDEIVGTNSYMQIIMARGLFDKWKQPIYIGFDQKTTKELLDISITKLHSIKYNVVACVSDCGAGNQGLWKELNININKTFYEHPMTNEPVYFFADVPHLLKLLRNWFIDTGFTLKDGTLINKNPIRSLIVSSNVETSSCHKLTDLHLTCSKTEMQNVRLAAEVFSNTTATALQYYMPGENKDLAKNVGNFLELVNNWFDIMNSYTPSANLPTNKPYGLDIQQQNKVLQNMKSTITGLLCNGKSTMQVFQKGIAISTSSLQNLHHHLKEKLQSTYILSHRLNQDCLENFFSQIRTRDWLHDHPSPLDALYRIRMILLGTNPGIVQSHTNVAINLDESEYVLASALKKASIKNIQIEQPVITEATISHASEGDENSSLPSNTSTVTSQQKVIEEDGLKYIAGYLAKQNLKSYPYLGKYTHLCKTINIHSYSIPTWIQSLSFGGLIEPSQEWSTQVEEMEKYFLKYHKDTFVAGKDIVKRTVNFVSEGVSDLNIPEDLVHSFSKLRVFIRIKYLNKKKDEAQQFRKRKYPDTHNANPRKVMKKIRKIIN